MKDIVEERVWANHQLSGGLMTAVPSHAVPPNFSPDAQNFDPSEYGQLKMRLGQTYFTSASGTPANKVRGLFAATNSSGTSKIIAKLDDTIYDISAGNWSTTIGTTYTVAATDEMHFAVFNDLIIMTVQKATAATNAPQKWAFSGASMSLLGGTPPQGQYICVHKNRVWMACVPGTSYSRVAYSALGNPEDWSTANNAGNFDVNKQDGFIINGIASDGDVLYISKIGPSGKEGAIYAVYGDGPSSFSNPKKVADLPAVSQRAFIATPFYVAVVTPLGVFALVPQNTVSNDRGLEPIGEPINNLVHRLNVAHQAIICCGRYKRQLWVSLNATNSGSGGNTGSLVLDIPTGRWSIYNSDDDHHWQFTTNGDGVMYASRGAATGVAQRIVKKNDGNADTDGLSFEMYWNTPNIDFGEWWVDKKLIDVTPHVKSESVVWTITPYIDDTAQTAITFNPTTETPGLIIPRVRITGSNKAGRMFRVKLSASSSTSQIEAYGIHMNAKMFPESR